jgi:hypothetical protein
MLSCWDNPRATWKEAIFTPVAGIRRVTTRPKQLSKLLASVILLAFCFFLENAKWREKAGVLYISCWTTGALLLSGTMMNR